MVFRVNRVLTIIVMLVFATLGAYAIAQPGGAKSKGKGQTGPARTDASSNIGNTQLLLNEKVRQELDIADEQAGQIRALSERFRRRLLGKGAGAKGRDNSEEMTRMQEEFDTELAEILRPSQIERFHQIEVQQVLQKDVLEALAGKGSIGEKLGVTEEQKKQLRAVSRDSDERVREEHERLRQEARESVIAALTPEQKEQLAKMTGETFDLEKRAVGTKRSGGGSTGKGAKGKGGANGRAK